MSDYQLERLLGLAAVVAVALVASLLLVRLTRRRPPEHDGILLGYPPEHYPLREAARRPALQALVAVQGRLISVYGQLTASGATPAINEMTIWLRVFLLELRRLMDGAYRVAAVTGAYGQSERLDRLVAEVEGLEGQIVDDITRRLMGEAGAGRPEVLDRRLVALRECASELGGLAEAPAAGT